MKTLWIKIPNAGEFRGEGTWHEVDQEDEQAMAEYDYCSQTGYLPVAEQKGMCYVSTSSDALQLFLG